MAHARIIRITHITLTRLWHIGAEKGGGPPHLGSTISTRLGTGTQDFLEGGGFRSAEQELAHEHSRRAGVVAAVLAQIHIDSLPAVGRG